MDSSSLAPVRNIQSKILKAVSMLVGDMNLRLVTDIPKIHTACELDLDIDSDAAGSRRTCVVSIYTTIISCSTLLSRDPRVNILPDSSTAMAVWCARSYQ